jgi:hypothetical protein
MYIKIEQKSELLCVFTDLILLFCVLLYLHRQQLLLLRFTIRNTRAVEYFSLL